MDERSGFARSQALVRSAHEYGLDPYVPGLPCKIINGGMFFECECGFETSSSEEIWDHCHNRCDGP
jgi:hypothetical protein